MSGINAPKRHREDGFTLMEILLAMTILVLGGVSVISLFAAAVSLQYDSVVNERKALILSDIVSEAQQVLNDHKPTKEQPDPPNIERKESTLYPTEFEYQVTFQKSGYIPRGEGAIAVVSMYYRGQELEPVKRGVYAGAVGYLSWSGNMDTAIAIRTAVIKDGTLHIQAGAGIVADSVPANEWDETMNKGRAIFRAVAMACGGLRTAD